MREAFLSKLVFQTYSGYVASQFKKMQTDIRNQGRVKWKHVMHLIRLLISGIDVLREGKVTVQVGEARGQLLAIKRAKFPSQRPTRGERVFKSTSNARFSKRLCRNVPTTNTQTSF